MSQKMTRELGWHSASGQRFQGDETSTRQRSGSLLIQEATLLLEMSFALYLTTSPMRTNGIEPWLRRG